MKKRVLEELFCGEGGEVDGLEDPAGEVERGGFVSIDLGQELVEGLYFVFLVRTLERQLYHHSLRCRLSTNVDCRSFHSCLQGLYSLLDVVRVLSCAPCATST